MVKGCALGKRYVGERASLIRVSPCLRHTSEGELGEGKAENLFNNRNAIYVTSSAATID